MSKLTVLDLFQCIFWAAAVGLPLICAYSAGSLESARERGRDGSGVWMLFIGVLLSGAGLVAAYKAGLK